MASEKKQLKKRKLQGVVVSDKMDKTVVVSVAYFKKDKKYRKQYGAAKRFKAHDEDNQYQVGDTVIFEETNPYSKEKRWKVTKLVERRRRSSAEEENDSKEENPN